MNRYRYQWKFVAANIFVLFSLMPSTSAQVLSKEKYLSKNYETLSFERQNHFKFFDKSFYANQMFLLGEMHGAADSYRVARLLADEFKSKTNFRYYLVEINHVDAARINQFLETGDENPLKAFFERIRGTFYYSRDYYEIFTRVRATNQKLRAKDRIRFIGVERFSPSNANLEYLLEMLRAARYKPGRLKTLDETSAIVAAPDNGGDRREIFVNELNRDLKQNEKTYREIFGTRFWEFEFLLDNFVASYAINRRRNEKPLSDTEVENIREEQMARNFAALYRHFNLRSEKIFGFFGREHIYKAAGKRTNWMAARIKQTLPDLKIVSLALRYKDSQYMIPTSFLERQFGTKQEKLYFYGAYQNDDSPFVKAVGINDLNAAAPPSAQTILFRLNAPDSPYRSLPDLVDEIADRKATTDYFDYAILVRKSAASVPIVEK